jgi:hypothetical protein
MNIRQSISHPELLVGSDGSIYYGESGQRINLIREHGTSIRGYMVAYRHLGKLKQVSVMRLVFEAHIKKDKVHLGDYVEVIDGDEYNPKVDNLMAGKKYSKPVKRSKKVITSGETYETWMGIDELYC